MPSMKDIEADCGALLFRALFEKEVTAFGEDGLGKYGTNDMPKLFMIDDIDIDLEYDEQTDEVLGGKAYLHLVGYSSKDCGHVATDLNLTISIARLLREHCIDPACLTWAPLKDQGDTYFTMLIDVPLLLSWS